jgi:hypothetical protein
MLWTNPNGGILRHPAVARVYEKQEDALTWLVYHTNKIHQNCSMLLLLGAFVRS